MIRLKYILPIALTAAATLSATAQESQSGGTPLQRELMLEREYNPDILDAPKQFAEPELAPPSVAKSDVEYAGFVIPFQPGRSLSLLTPGEVNTAIKHSKKRGYLNLAGGNYLNFNGDFGYNILEKPKDKLSIWYSHRSTHGDVKYLPQNPTNPVADAGIDIKQRAKLNDNTANIDYAHTFNKTIWNLSAGYGMYGFNYYGRPYNLSERTYFDLEKMQQNQLIETKTGLKSKENDVFNYDIELSYYNFSRKLGAYMEDKGVKENSLDLEFDFFAGFKSNKRIGLHGHANGFFYNVPKNNTTFVGFKDYVDICLNPYFGIENSSWNLRLGLLTHFDIGQSDFMISPDVHFDWTFAQRTKLYVKATGDVRHNSNRDMLSSYRYVAPNIRADHTKDWIKAEIGVRSQPVTRFWFDISAGYDIMQDELFMMPVLGHYGSIYGGYDPYGYYGHGYRDFTALYDDGKTEYYANVIDFRHMKAKKFHAGGSFNYQIINNLIFTAKIRGNLWRAENGTTPYGKPKREMGAALAYRPIPKLLLDLNYEHVGGHFLLIGLSEMGTPDINELSLKGTYTFNDTFSLYAKANNLLNRKYEWWWGYPMQGFNFQIGGAVNF